MTQGKGRAWRVGAVIVFAVGHGAAAAANLGPSNLGPGFCDVPQATDLAQATSRTFNTDTECSSVVTQSGGPPLCVIRYRQITIGPGATIGSTGSRVLVLAASIDFVLQGTVDVTAGAIGFGPSPGPAAPPTGGGAAGGGHGSPGGTGGTGSGAGSPGGIVAGVPALVPLTTGSRGGGSGSGGSGGLGGGAVQLVACGRFLLDATGQVRANGLGGQGGAGGAAMSDGAGGAGGGSGGGILIEGDIVDLLGTLVANGGGGGGGGSGGGFGSTGANGGPGGTGSINTFPATGGTAGNSTPNGGVGGSGSALAPPSNGTNGADGAVSTGGGGGGGGAAGRIRVNSCSTLTNTPALVSPTPSVGTACDRVFANGFE